MPQILSFLYEFNPALRTFDTYSALSAGNTDFLGTARALENLMRLFVLHSCLKSVKTPYNPVSEPKIRLILIVSLGYIARQHPEISIYQKRNRQQI